MMLIREDGKSKKVESQWMEQKPLKIRLRKVKFWKDNRDIHKVTLQSWALLWPPNPYFNFKHWK